MENVITLAKKQVAKQILKIVMSSEKNMIRAFKLAEKLTKSDKNAVIALRKMVEDPNHPARDLAKKILNLSPKCKEKVITNLFINSFLFSNDKRKAFAKEAGFMPPYLLVISPSMRCNISCIGCYAGEYTKKDDLPIEVVDRILTEAKEMGIYFITVSGGEPFIRKDVVDLFEKHDDMYFQVYTNGTLIDKKMAARLAELGNVAPAISVEGFEKETDTRRGTGVHKQVLTAMKNLKEAGVPFGFSATPTKLNAEVLMSDEFIDFYIKQGALFGWYFQYIPIGKKPDVSLMSTPEQRIKLGKRVHEIRESKPIFLGDFWNDGAYVCGCMAGARKYIHITCKGDVEPCVFTHFTVDNIKEKSLKECLQSDFFAYIREQQKDIKNLLTPCCIIDNPHILRDACEKYGAKPSHPGAETIIKDPKIRAHLDDYSKKMHAVQDKEWNENPQWKGHKKKWDEKRKAGVW